MSDHFDLSLLPECRPETPGSSTLDRSIAASSWDTLCGGAQWRMSSIHSTVSRVLAFRWIRTILLSELNLVGIVISKITRRVLGKFSNFEFFSPKNVNKAVAERTRLAWRMVVRKRPPYKQNFRNAQRRLITCESPKSNLFSRFVCYRQFGLFG